VSETPGVIADRREAGRREWLRFVRFVVAAGASVPVNIGARILLSRWGVTYEVAVLLSHGVGMVTAYALTRLFVFGTTGRGVPHELARFAVVNVGSAAVTWVVSVGLVRYVFPAMSMSFHPELVGHVIGLASSSVAAFLGHRQFTFRQ
jgi:putative flippase GtrA